MLDKKDVIEQIFDHFLLGFSLLELTGLSIGGIDIRILKLDFRAVEQFGNHLNFEANELLGSNIHLIMGNQPARSEVKRRGCVIDLVRTPELNVRVGDELTAYIKFN